MNRGEIWNIFIHDYCSVFVFKIDYNCCLLSHINESVGGVSKQLVVDPVEVVQPPHLLLGQLAVVGEVVPHGVPVMTCHH